MMNPGQDHLKELLRQFLEAPAAEAAYRDIQAGERLLEAHPAPAPESRVILAIKAQMAGAARRQQRIVRLVRGALATAAAVIVLALIGLPDPGARNSSALSYASLIPTAIWESDDIAADDLDIVYFSAEIRHLEAQMRALDAGEEQVGGAVPDEFENELMAIEIEFWKG
ncbi:MAG: hypothetical protein MUC88_20580 [Planctomycetes bacterium]|jgi:hypothetical protein|nr:hypothetical protein [Planctomycetota bacterium]